jgi:uncharacterized protein (UPF0297 family)
MNNPDTGDEYKVKAYKGERGQEPKIRIQAKDEEWAFMKDDKGKKLKREFTDPQQAAVHTRLLVFKNEDIENVLKSYASVNAPKQERVKEVMANVARSGLVTKTYNNKAKTIQATIGPDMVRIGRNEGGKWRVRAFDADKIVHSNIQPWVGDEEEVKKIIKKHEKVREKFDKGEPHLEVNTCQFQNGIVDG